MNGEPLLHGDAASDAEGVALRIAHDLRRWLDSGRAWPRHSASVGELAGGYAGVALLFHECARLTNDPQWSNARDACWERSVHKLGTVPSSAEFFTGFTGAAWVGSVLADAPPRYVIDGAGADAAWSSDDAHDMDAFAEIDDVALAAMSEDIAMLTDLVGGLAGVATYFATRAPRPAAHVAMTRFVERLAATALEDERGIYWTPDLTLLPAGADPARFSLGCAPLAVAHGLAGILCTLARCIEAGVDLAAAPALFDGGTRFLLATRRATATTRQFPSSVHRDGTIAAGASTWCWGDIGIVAVLHAAARRVGHQVLEAAMVDAADALVHVSPASEAYPDASLCHGMAGRAHLLNRLQGSMGTESIAVSARSWVQATLAARGSDGFGGYTFNVHADGRTARCPSAGLLIGSAGVALALLSACSSGVPRWDVPFGVDQPVSRGRVMGTT